MFEERREQMLEDSTTNTLFGWIADLCSLYIGPFVYEYVVNTQHRGEGVQKELQGRLLGDLWISWLMSLN